MHPQATNPQIDFDAYVRKVKAGAHGVVTQYFYNADAYFDFVERSERAGLAVPVVPGLMPIVNTAQLLRFRSEERRVGQECVSPCRSRWSPSHSKNTHSITPYSPSLLTPHPPPSTTP